jgi:hypothetical protein
VKPKRAAPPQPKPPAAFTPYPRHITRNLFGTGPNTDGRGGGNLPSLWPTYPRDTARALAQLAESRPDPETYAREKEAILAGTRR